MPRQTSADQRLPFHRWDDGVLDTDTAKIIKLMAFVPGATANSDVLSEVRLQVVFLGQPLGQRLRKLRRKREAEWLGPAGVKLAAGTLEAPDNVAEMPSYIPPERKRKGRIA